MKDNPKMQNNYGLLLDAEILDPRCPVTIAEGMKSTFKNKFYMTDKVIEHP